MLYDREQECAALGRLVREAASGRGGALVLLGDPGSGKTTLLQHVAARATRTRVLQTCGHPRETGLAFAGLRDVLSDLLPWLDRLPPAQAAALGSALAVQPPAPAAQLLVHAGALNLIAAAAEEMPLLVLVDDLHWLDPPSGEALLFCARRLAAERAAMLFTARVDEVGGLDIRGLARRQVGGLTAGGCAQLLHDLAAAPIDPRVAERLATSTGGNPLALVELATLLPPEVLAGLKPLADPPPVGPGIEDAFRSRIERLSAAARDFLLLAAVAGEDAAVVMSTAAALNIPPGVLEEVESAGLVRLTGGTLRFRHPLLRGVAYQRGSAGAVRAAHAAVADVLGRSASESSADRRAWHLAAAAVGADEVAASALSDVGARAFARSAYSVASAAWERAAGLSGPGPTKVDRLVSAAEAAQLAGSSTDALAYLHAALDEAGTAHRRAAIRLRLGMVHVWAGGSPGVAAQLVAAAGEVAGADPDLACELSATATVLHITRAEVGAARRAAAAAVETSRRAGPDAQALVSYHLGAAMVLTGEYREGLRRVAEGEVLCARLQAHSRVGQAILVAAPWPHLWVEDHERAAALVDGIVATARAEHAPALLPFGLMCRFELEFRAGEWAAAYATAGEAVDLCREFGDAVVLEAVLSFLARLAAAQGREAECLATIDTAIGRAHGGRAVHHYCLAARGLLELGCGRPAAAIPVLEELAADTRRLGLVNPLTVQWQPDLIEAYVRVGRRRDAEEQLADLRHRLVDLDSRWGAAAAERCAGLLTDGPFDHHFAAAEAEHRRLAMPFELARTWACWGERLRRGRRLAPARSLLHQALEGFEALGARSWAEHALAELRLTGGRRREHPARTALDLTPQELRVALALARGLSNLEIAGELFVSRKTVEYHVSHLYRKLQVRSRVQLAGLVRQHSPSALVPVPRAEA